MKTHTLLSIFTSLLITDSFFGYENISKHGEFSQTLSGLHLLGFLLIVAVLWLGYFARNRYDRYLDEKRRK